MARAKKEVKDQPIEQVIWAAADKLPKNMMVATQNYKSIPKEVESSDRGVLQ